MLPIAGGMGWDVGMVLEPFPSMAYTLFPCFHWKICTTLKFWENVLVFPFPDFPPSCTFLSSPQIQGELIH